MKEIKSFWCNDKPTLEDILKAFALAYMDYAVEIKWHVNYSGDYCRIITRDIAEKYKPEEYFEKFIPHTYPV